MQKTATVLDVTRKRGNAPRQGMITGEPGAGKLACRVREEADGKGPMGTSPAAYFTWEGADGKGLPRVNLAGDEQVIEHLSPVGALLTADVLDARPG